LRQNEKQQESGDNCITGSSGDHLYPSPNYIRGIALRRTRGSGKSKGKVHPRTGVEGPQGEKRYSSTLSLISVLDRVGGQGHVPAALPPGRTRYPLYRRLDGPQGPFGRVRKISPHRDSIPRPPSP